MDGGRHGKDVVGVEFKHERVFVRVNEVAVEISELT